MKEKLRVEFRRLRQRHALELQQVLDQSLQHWLTPGLSQTGERHLGFFWPLGSEPDLRTPLQALGTPLALPVVEADRLLYRPWRPDTPLVADACGIPAPPASEPALAPEQLALLVVPALAIDRQGMRLGSGGGWYDRLRSDPAWRAVPALVVLPARCVIERLPTESWDVPFDGWIDQTGCHWLGGRRF
ncbi:MAG: 5-formyltetrahydrofolate cyclo-ligase [Cyanobacteriota bacterium]|nr:5-formyltetrahydrofolate cyclo-ligase [Cyanobacteriota bacterium]